MKSLGLSFLSSSFITSLQANVAEKYRPAGRATLAARLDAEEEATHCLWTTGMAIVGSDTVDMAFDVSVEMMIR